MNEQCSARIDAETLSAWRSRLLTPQEQQSITTHIADCAACQQIIAGFDRIAQILRTPSRMPSQDSIWRGVQASITRKRGPVMHMPKSLFAGIGVAVALATVFIVVFVALANRSGHTTPISIISTAPPTVTPTTISSPTSISTPLPNIWQPAALINYGKAIAFARSDPQTGYVCGDSSPGDTVTTLELGVTHDGGHTWTTKSLQGITGDNCNIAVNPYNANDIVLSIVSCWVDCNGISYNPYRSLDGGKTWTHQVLPPGNGASVDYFLNSPVWTPTALFFYVSPISAAVGFPAHLIAVSVNGGSLTWTTNPEPQTNDQIIQIFTVGNSIHAFDDVPSDVQGNHWDLATSTDNGATWVHIKPQGTTIPDYVQSDSDVHIVLGFIFGIDVPSYLRSTDGGRTWGVLPTLPAGGHTSLLPGAQAPDGTIFGLYSVLNTGDSIYKLAPGGTDWTSLGSIAQDPAGNQDSIAVSCDVTGHPEIVWLVTSKASGSGSNQTFLPVLEYHPA